MRIVSTSSRRRDSRQRPSGLVKSSSMERGCLGSSMITVGVGHAVGGIVGAPVGQIGVAGHAAHVGGDAVASVEQIGHVTMGKAVGVGQA